MSDGIRVLTNVGRKRHLRIACSLTDSHDAGSRVALKNRAVLSKSDLAGRVFRGLPIRVVGAALNVVDGLAIQFKWKTQFHQRLHFALSRENAVFQSVNLTQMAGAPRGEPSACRPLHVHHTASGEVTFERTSRFLFNLSPRLIGNGS